MDFFRARSIVTCCILFIFIPIAASAENLFSNANTYSVSVDFGITKPTNVGNAAVSFPLGYSTFIYNSNHNNQSVLMGGLSLDKVLTINSLYQLQVGLSYHSMAHLKVTGNLEQGISQPYYQSTYSYNIGSSQYLVETKLQHQFYNHYSPYVYLGLGVANNRAYNYATPAPNTLVVTPDYQDRTINAFTYSLGAGIDYFVAKKLSVGLGYRFADLGAVGLGSGTIRNTQVSAELKQSHLYINTLLAQLTYFI